MSDLVTWLRQQLDREEGDANLIPGGGYQPARWTAHRVADGDWAEIRQHDLPYGVESDGEVPEAGRAGEAQTSTCSTCDGVGYVHCAAHVAGDGCDELAIDCPDCSYSAVLGPDASKNSSDVRPQDRTEGLDAAIEAARLELGRTAMRGDWLAAVIRAASPLIERAALHAAAALIRAEAEAEAVRLNVTDPTLASTPINNWLAGIREGAKLIEARATRTEMS